MLFVVEANSKTMKKNWKSESHIAKRMVIFKAIWHLNDEELSERQIISAIKHHSPLRYKDERDYLDYKKVVDESFEVSIKDIDINPEIIASDIKATKALLIRKTRELKQLQAYIDTLNNKIEELNFILHCVGASSHDSEMSYGDVHSCTIADFWPK